ncbi:MAG TPA: hypothetical protein VFE88_01905 [Candidatus Nanoarchaeia archaeon]|nr:hypothetical protein [Candidatus Nanoarchaeia archaeon]
MLETIITKTKLGIATLALGAYGCATPTTHSPLYGYFKTQKEIPCARTIQAILQCEEPPIYPLVVVHFK